MTRSPGLRPDGEEALVQEGEVHHGPLPHPQEVLEERIAADADDRLAEGQPFEVLHDQSPQDVLRGVVALAALGVAFGKLQEVLVDGREDLGIVVEDLTDGPVSGTIVPYDLGQPVVAGLETQHGFHSSDASLFSYVVVLNNHEDKDASFLFKPDRRENRPAKLPQQKQIRDHVCGIRIVSRRRKRPSWLDKEGREPDTTTDGT